MDGLAKVLDLLYRGFLLRDLLAKIVPGLLVLVGAAMALTGDTPAALYESYVDGRGWGLAPAVALAAWPLGFVTQALARLGARLVRFVTGPLARWQYYQPPDAAGWVELVVARTGFPEAHRQNLERLAVIKEATGGYAIGLLISAAGVTAGPGMGDGLLMMWRLAAFVAVVLLWVHVDVEWREVTMQRQIQATHHTPAR